MTFANSASALYRAIAASPRPAGGSEEQKARQLCRAYLEDRGFICREQRFEYSSFPARFVVPLVGVVFLGCAVAIGCANATDRAVGVTSLTVAAIWCMALGLAGWLGRCGTISFPWFRRESVNLEATRPGLYAVAVSAAAEIQLSPTKPGIEPVVDEEEPALYHPEPTSAGSLGASSQRRAPHHPEPALWLMAHLDSKSQPIPMALRVSAVFASLVGWIGIFILSLVTSAIGGALLSAIHPAIVAFAVLAAMGAVGLMCCVIGNKSAGALDNASGVATVLASIDHIDPKVPLRVILPSAEEIGLAGAYAYLNEWKKRKRLEQEQDTAPAATQPPIIINCDSFDDRGSITCMFPKRDTAFFHPICADASHQTNTPINTRRLIPGILTDSVVFSASGLRAMTISRGTWSTLARIHSRRDTISATPGAKIDHNAVCISRIVMNIAQRTLFSPSLID